MKMYESVSMHSTIILVNSTSAVTTLQNALKKVKVDSAAVFEGMGSDERGTQMENFKRGRVHTLITTEMLSLGFEDSYVDIVINYDVPVLGISRLDWETRMRSIMKVGKRKDHGYVVSLVATEQEKDFK